MTRGWRRPVGHGVVTYSPKVFIPVTKLCRDRCHYCTFVESPGQLKRAGHAMFLSPDEILEIARQGAALGCLEALFTLGDRPEDRWPEAREWLDEQGYDSTLAYLRAMAVRVLEETGLLPHLNPGVMSWEELNRLKPVSPSMGMMLETTSRRLFETKGEAHFGSPDKDPEVRLRVLEDAGRLSIPFTTGLLVGIGETLTERAETILALRATSRAYGAVQEVIVQNFRAKPDTAMRHADDLGLEEFRAAIAVTRLLLGPKARVQAPPNLVDLAECRALLEAGVDDWGGVSPLTPDHVNPERPWPSLERLRVGHRGVRLRARGPAHRAPGVRPRTVSRGWTRGSRRTSRRWRREDGLARPGVRPVGLPWQEPDGGFASVGPHRPVRGGGQRGPHRRPALGLLRRLRRLGVGQGRGRGGLRRSRHARPQRDRRGHRRAARRREGPRQPLRRARAHPDDGRGTTARAGLPARRRPAPRHRRRRRDLRGQPQHQLHQRLLRRVPVLRLRAATDRRGRLLALARRGRRPGRRGLAARRHRGLHAGRHRPGAAGDGLLRPRHRGEATGAADARARVQPHGGRQRHRPHRPVDRGLPDQGPRGRARLDPGDRGRDPRRRGAVGADQGQAADPHLDRGGLHGAPGRRAEHLAR